MNDFDPKKDIAKNLAVNHPDLMKAVREDSMQFLAHCVAELGGEVSIGLPLVQTYKFSAEFNTRTEVIVLKASRVSEGGIILPNRKS